MEWRVPGSANGRRTMTSLFPIDEPRPKPWKPEAPTPGRQRVLFAGLDCLAGQRDLFDTDGQPDREADRQRLLT